MSDTIKDKCIDFLLDRNKQLAKVPWNIIHKVMMHIEKLKKTLPYSGLTDIFKGFHYTKPNFNRHKKLR